MTDRQKVLNVLNSAIAPMPIDQISNSLNEMGIARVREVLNTLRRCNKIKRRKCRDDRFFTEWWLIEKEGELIL